MFFDGICNLCNSSVQWIIRHDKNAVIQFAALQSGVAKQLLEPKGVDVSKLESVVLLEDGVVFTKSDAALRIARAIGAPWAWVGIFRFIPKPIRDALYLFVATHRYAWFGQRDACMMPTPELKKRFL